MAKLNKERVESLFIKGYKPREIANKLSTRDLVINDRSVSKCIERNFSHLKAIHDKNYQERRKIKKEILRTLNTENSKIMSTADVVKHNIQSYRFDGKRYVYDSSNGARPLDLPQVYSRKV